MAERRAKCAVAIPEDFIFYKTPLGVIPPYAKIVIDMPNVWAHLRPDIIEWIEHNIARKASIRIEDHWEPRGAPLVVKGGKYIQAQTLAGKVVIFENQHDAALFKMFWI